MVQVAIIGVVIGLLAAGCEGPPTEPNDARSLCGRGPFPVATSGPESCPGLASRCPDAPPQDATTLIWVNGCGFREGEADCQPVPLIPGCPQKSYAPIMTLRNPNRDASHPCIIGGELQLLVFPTANGGATVQWRAHERDAVTCNVVGPDIDGSGVVDGPCCEKVFDVYFPAGKFTQRIVIRTDWQP
jgi:hypothetical protein